MHVFRHVRLCVMYVFGVGARCVRLLRNIANMVFIVCRVVCGWLVCAQRVQSYV